MKPTLDYAMHSSGKQTPVTSQYISILDTFTAIFECSNVYNTAHKYMSEKQNSDSVLTDIRDGPNYCNTSPNTFPFIIFFDELESGNTLESHSGQHKIGAMYVSLRCFPTYFSSKLKNIYICSLFPSKARQYLDKLLKKIIEDINELQINGLYVNGQRFFFISWYCRR